MPNAAIVKDGNALESSLIDCLQWMWFSLSFFFFFLKLSNNYGENKPTSI